MHGMALLEEKTRSTGLLGSVSRVEKAVRKLTITMSYTCLRAVGRKHHTSFIYFDDLGDRHEGRR